MAKKKVKKTKSSAAKKGRASSKKKAVRKSRRTAQEKSPGVIFDSQVGKTDALFVSSPDAGNAAASTVAVVSDPEIDQAIKELDALSSKPGVQEIQQPVTEDTAQTKKSFWKKIFFFMK